MTPCIFGDCRHRDDCDHRRTKTNVTIITECKDYSVVCPCCDGRGWKIRSFEPIYRCKKCNNPNPHHTPCKVCGFGSRYLDKGGQ